VTDERTQTTTDQVTAGGTGAERGPDAAGQAPDAAELAVELERLRDRWLRARADLENYRKRSAQEVERRVGDARDRLLLDWLDVVDSVDRALQLDRGQGADDGLRAVLEQMHAVLARHGVRRVESRDEPFDPARHEAVGVQASEQVPEHTVLDVAREGYALGDRVLRPAQVIVARRPADPQEDG